MAFPNSIECHISSINSTPVKTDVVVKIYLVTDGGLDSDGNQLYNRTLFRQESKKFDAGWDKTRIVDYFKSRLAVLNTQFSLGYTADRFICNL